MGRQIASEMNACRSHNIQIRTSNSHNQQKNQLAFHSRRSINMKKNKKIPTLILFYTKST